LPVTKSNARSTQIQSITTSAQPGEKQSRRKYQHGENLELQDTGIAADVVQRQGRRNQQGNLA